MRSRRTAFTLVEMLVVITIIGMLMALLLPAIQSAREAARQTVCTTNQQNIAKAILGYAAAKDSKLPPSMSIGLGGSSDMTDPVARRRVWGWVPPLLRELGQPAIHDQMIDTVGDLASPAYENLFANLYFRELDCPSDTTRETLDQPWISYYVNGGRANRGADPMGFGGAQPGPPDWKENGAMDVRFGTIGSTNTLDGISRGDGTSMTLLTVENVSHRVFDPGGSPVVLGNTWSNTFINSSGVVQMDPPVEFHNAVFWQAGTAGGNPAPVPNEFVGDGEEGDVYVNAHRDDPLDRAHARPSSYHPGIIIVTFCDGHTQRLSETIDYGVYCLIMSSKGRDAKTPGALSGNDAPWQSAAVSEADLAP